MEYLDYLKILQRDIHSVVLATNDGNGHHIGQACAGCGICAQKCPMHCIVKGTPYRINEENCLHCGNCYEACPEKAVRKWGAV